MQERKNRTICVRYSNSHTVFFFIHSHTLKRMQTHRPRKIVFTCDDESKTKVERKKRNEKKNQKEKKKGK